MQKILKNIGLAIVVGVLSFSCEEELDVNKNLNTPTNVDASLFLTAAEASLATVLGGELTNYGGFMAQYHTQAPAASQYDDVDKYNVTPSFSNLIWREGYGGINDLDKVIELSVGNTGNLLIAKSLRAYYFQVLTDFFGNIPYANILPGVSNLNPIPIDQQLIYQSLLEEVENAIKAYEENSIDPTFGEQDIFLENNIDKWIQFANTLLLKMNLRLSEKDVVNSEAIITLLSKDDFLKENVAFDIYIDEINKRNPFNDVQLKQFGGNNHVASNSLLNYLLENDDPRREGLYTSFEIEEGIFQYFGIEQGNKRVFESDPDNQFGASDFSQPIVSETQPVYLFTKAEINFLQAEASVRYRGGAQAKEKYEEGIRDSFTLLGKTTAEADVLINGFYVYNEGGSSQEKVEQIMVQKWVANAYVNTIEAYFDQLRTGYPKIIPKNEEPDYSLGRLRVSQASVFLSNTATPLSMFYSQDEVNTNENLSQKSSLTVPVWWASENN